MNCWNMNCDEISIWNLDEKHEKYKKELLECSEKGVEISEECKVYFKKQLETSENDERKENSKRS